MPGDARPIQVMGNLFNLVARLHSAETTALGGRATVEQVLHGRDEDDTEPPYPKDQKGQSEASEAPVEEALARVVAMLPGGGEVREGQVEMANAVAAAGSSGRHLIVRAGTGTGKSLAYLVPAALSGKKVVVATATKNLQDQLAHHDLPLVAKALGNTFSFAVLKGRSNYLCRQRAVEISDGGYQGNLALSDDASADADPADEARTEPESSPDSESGNETLEDVEANTPFDSEVEVGRLVDQLQRLLRWATKTTTGDRADLAFEPGNRAWGMLSVGPRECPGAFRCPSGGSCFAELARINAATADIVVVNTHLYGTHIASGGAVLPPHDMVVFDEAHQLEEVMTSCLGAEVAPARFRALAALARPLMTGTDATAIDELVEVGDRLQEEIQDRTGTRVLQSLQTPGENVNDRESEQETQADLRLSDLIVLARARIERVTTTVMRNERQSRDGDSEGVAPRVLTSAAHLSGDMARLATPSDGDVSWVDGTRRAPVLRLSPIDVGPALSASVWNETTAVLTSATIPLRIRERVGLDEHDSSQIDVGSPFDYRSCSLLYVARHLPDPRHPDAESAILSELQSLIGAAGGRTLALFTSIRATERASAALSELIDQRVLVQGALPKRRLLEAFSEDETSCLFATLGFWQGVDVPGRSLSLVTLDRIPFPRPGDPLTDARRARAGERAFSLVDIPRAATLLAQGAGRLIRSASDKGVVAVLDPRLATASYRRQLLAALPPMRRTTDRRQVEDFLARALGE